MHDGDALEERKLCNVATRYPGDEVTDTEEWGQGLDEKCFFFNNPTELCAFPDTIAASKWG